MSGEAHEGDGVHDSVQWLEWLYGQKPPGLIWIGGHGDGWKGRLFATAGEAGEYARWLDDLAAGGVYFRLTPTKPPELWVSGGQGRGVAEDSSHLVAFGADLDLAGPGHKATKLPRPATDDGLLRIMEAAGVPAPTAWINSGGGRYAFWRLEEPLPLDTPEKLASAQERSAALHARIIAEAAAAGFKIDNTRDLARVYRLPGTHNRKGETPFVATVITSFGPQYSIGAFSATPSSSSSAPPSSSSVPLSAASWERESITGGGTALFGGGAGAGTARGDAPRSFTLAQAREFVTPFLVALREARDGEINVRLNEAAIAMAHFGEEFWPAGTADAVLYDNLSHTVYDGATWQAEHTIASARRGAGWHAVLLPDDAAEWTAGQSPAEDAVDALLAEMLTMDELAERVPPRYMIKDLLSYDSETWLIGGPGSKKSFVAFDMAASVATGKPWQGLKVNPGLVVFIAAEGAGGFGKRAKAWRKKYGNVPAERMRTLPRPVQAGDAAAWAVLVAACRRLREALDPDLGMFVVIDTQARSAAGLDENSVKEIGVYIRAVTAIRQATRACVMSVHHTSKAGEVTRGSSALDGAQDTRLLMKSDRGSLEATLKIDKQKDLEQIDDITLRFEKVDVGQDVDGEPIDSLVLMPAGGWGSGLFDKRSAAQIARQAEIAQTPFAGRQQPEEWTHRLTARDAELQRWLLQALADTAEDRGLTQAEWRGLVDEKLGKNKPTASAWRKAFQRVTSADQKFSEVVVKIHGADRWTVDKVAIKAGDSE